MKYVLLLAVSLLLCGCYESREITRGNLEYLIGRARHGELSYVGSTPKRHYFHSQFMMNPTQRYHVPRSNLSLRPELTYFRHADLDTFGFRFEYRLTAKDVLVPDAFISRDDGARLELEWHVQDEDVTAAENDRAMELNESDL